MQLLHTFLIRSITYGGFLIEQKTQESTNRQVKSSAFTTLFGEDENAAKLYAALNGEETVFPEEIEFTTLQGVLFMLRKNDLAFVAKKKVLAISEHQSTVNNNMPLRDVIYNGDRAFPPEQILKLSDAFLEKTGEPMLELIVRIININLPVNHPILERCRPLYEYSWFIQQIKTHQSDGMGRDDAIVSAMADCRKEGILEDFLREHGTEAVNMLFTEFNMEDALDVRYAEGMAEGKARSILELLEDLGRVPADLKETILRQQNPEVLTRWHKLAAKAKNITEFESQMH